MKSRLWVVLSLIYLSTPTHAATWYVEQDGSGQFYCIQSAVNAAASGDTIRIGPGRYVRYHEVETDISYSACVHWSEDKSLTFIGTGADEVFIGPMDHDQTPSRSVGFLYSGSDSETQVFRSLALHKCATGVRSNSGLSFAKCKFIETGVGVTGRQISTLIFKNCSISPYPTGLPCYGLDVTVTGEFNLMDCTFNTQFTALVGNGRIHNCRFHSHKTWLGNMTGEFSNNTIRLGSSSLYASYGLQIGGQCNLLLKDNIIDGGRHALHIRQNSQVQMFGNVLTGTSHSTIRVEGHSSVTGSGNHIFHGGSQYTVELSGYVPQSPGRIDLRNNYWGTTDLDLIDSWMLNSWLTPVEFLPIADGPMPTERKNWGSVKAMYR